MVGKVGGGWVYWGGFWKMMDDKQVAWISYNFICVLLLNHAGKILVQSSGTTWDQFWGVTYLPTIERNRDWTVSGPKID